MRRRPRHPWWAGRRPECSPQCVQSWGAVLTLANGVVYATDPYTSGLTIDFRGALAQSSGDALTLRNFTVVRLP